MPPEAVAALLRESNERMTEQIFVCGGTVDKYIGDEILAVFGVPEATPDDAANALRCADRMLAALDRWNAERQGMGEPALRIGINSITVWRWWSMSAADKPCPSPLLATP